jgi:trehalose synthase
MLPTVHLAQHGHNVARDLELDRRLVGDELIDELAELARQLKGVRICHINSTASGGGVAELLSRYLPLIQSLGITADWHVIHGQPEFFAVTKAFHNALQGGRYDLREAAKRTYLAVNQESARQFEGHYDVVIVNDPQPAALRHFAHARGSKWIWRCHIDTSEPNQDVERFLLPYIEEYDAVVFTMTQFCLPGLKNKDVVTIAPAIDPFSTKNMELPADLCRRAIADSGVDVNRPILLQVARFDPWKDPLGVIETYRLVQKEIDDVQLVLIGAMASDDPEGWDLLKKVQAEAKVDSNIHVFTNLSGVGNMEVNVFQRGCDVVIQKSLREGFGLVVSEAFWKEKPVVAGRAGGIPMQFPAGFDSYLIDSIETCAQRIVELLGHKGAQGELGRAGREQVRSNFLIPRLVRDELRLVQKVLSDAHASHPRRVHATKKREHVRATP